MTQENYINLSKEQLILYIRKLELDFHDFTQQSNQVEDILQLQINTYKLKISEKDDIIKNLKMAKLENDSNQYVNLQSKIISLETENDLLESTIRLLTSNLETEIEKYNECIEKIAFLENEVDWFKSAMTIQENDINSNQKVVVMNSNNGVLTHLEKPQNLDNWENEWLEKEKLWSEKINSLQEKLDQITNNDSNLEKELELVKMKNFELEHLLKHSENEKELLLQRLKKFKKNYVKIRQIMTLVKLRQHGPVKAYSTPALTSMA